MHIVNVVDAVGEVNDILVMHILKVVGDFGELQHTLLMHMVTIITTSSNFPKSDLLVELRICPYVL